MYVYYRIIVVFGEPFLRVTLRISCVRCVRLIGEYICAGIKICITIKCSVWYVFRGLWNVPYISGCYLINGTVLRNAEMRPDYSYRNLDYDMAFCEDMRKKVMKFRLAGEGREGEVAGVFRKLPDTHF